MGREILILFMGLGQLLLQALLLELDILAVLAEADPLTPAVLAVAVAVAVAPTAAAGQLRPLLRL
jgi:hypothetical protein